MTPMCKSQSCQWVAFILVTLWATETYPNYEFFAFAFLDWSVFETFAHSLHNCTHSCFYDFFSCANSDYTIVQMPEYTAYRYICFFFTCMGPTRFFQCVGIAKWSWKQWANIGTVWVHTVYAVPRRALLYLKRFIAECAMKWRKLNISGLLPFCGNFMDWLFSDFTWIPEKFWPPFLFGH
jgi:hypothetical protein